MKTGLKKIFFILFAAALVTLVSTCAYTDISPAQGPLVELETDTMVGRTTFGWNETPWAKVSFYPPGGTTGIEVEWTWKHGESETTPTSMIKTGADLYSTSPVIFAQDLDNWLTKADRLGLWTVSTHWKHRMGTGDWQDHWTEGDDVRFQVTPEPVASALFLIGGAAIVALRKKRK